MTLFARAILPVLFAISSGPVLALSCLPPDVARTYNFAQESEDRFVVVYGELSFDEVKLPQTDWENQEATPPDTFIPATLKGQSLDQTGFAKPFVQEITMNARCFGPWCAGGTSDLDYLAFLKETDEGYLLELDPCGGMAFVQPSKETLNKVKACFQGKSCNEDSLK
ncbi:hypothetical protein ROA7450_01899 [Roseovarius albus]|uniref:Uncharacterized protein n=1 Tax=Roseovarius albus TaxID=1247867 RepID=A0A1X6Z3Q2_9RHOB|nr:hypothetical protein [Roseovarius albus]SLN39858.1 hypothetical protein ROA7450_01899 [Roseovarius albus]